MELRLTTDLKGMVFLSLRREEGGGSHFSRVIQIRRRIISNDKKGQQVVLKDGHNMARQACRYLGRY